MKIPYLDLSIQGDMLSRISERIQKVLSSGQYILGEELRTFEHTFANYVGTKYAIGVNSGYSALYLVLKAISIKPGDEILTVSNTFVATVAAIEEVGAKPIFIDIGEDGNINPELIEQSITSRTKCILPVHLSGNPCKMDQINEIAKRYNLFVVEDSAQSIGSEIYGKKTGGMSDVSCFSLHPTKVLGACGDAGIITTNRDDIYESIVLLRNHGLINREECVMWGDNSRLDEIQATILNEKFMTLDKDIERRRAIADLYSQLILNKRITLHKTDFGYKSNYFNYMIRCSSREQLKHYLQKNGIDVRIHYPVPVHQQPVYVNKYGRLILTQTEQRAKEILSLPCNSQISDDEVSFISQVVNSFSY
ncbi:MAG: DegT/DnrJ/EryC1/StrS family aminotransferase [Lutisporaceae bacterium]